MNTPLDRARSALADYGFRHFDAQPIGGSIVRVVLEDGPALADRLEAARIALGSVDLVANIFAGSRAVVASTRTLRP